VDRYQDRMPPGPRRRIAGRGRPRGRHARGLAPGGEPPAFQALSACPTAADASPDGVRPDADANLTLAPSRRPRPHLEPSWQDSLLASARQFITLFYTENRLGSPDRRLWHVRHEIEEWGTYWHTPQELAFGARLAWRNSPQGIGRLDWLNLRVRDRRDITSARDVAAEAVTHLYEATNGGRIRPLITVFAPDTPDRAGPRILNSQLIRYAGYQAADGVVTGDPANADLTRLARSAGWQGGQPAGRFDVLPLLVREAGGPVTAHEVPSDIVLEVAITHPEFRWFADLGLRWYAVPVISDMYLDIGGVRYPAAPFNGWHLGTEIGWRDLGGRGRYDQLPVIAAGLGLPVASDRSLWEERAMAELNMAVLHSFAAAAVTITGHPAELSHFLRRIRRTERHDGAFAADWTWIVPPVTSSAAPGSHGHCDNFDWAPSFCAYPPLASRPRPGRRDLQLVPAAR
jgi:nitric-oxide synthase